MLAEIEPIDPSFLDRRSEAEAEAALRTAEANRALAEAALAEAEAELEFANAERNRSRRLSRAETISAQALDEAERRFKIGEAAVATARAELQARTFALEGARARLMSPMQARSATGMAQDECDCIPLLAPVDGKVLRIVRESEGVVTPGEPLVELGDPSNIEVVADEPPSHGQ